MNEIEKMYENVGFETEIVPCYSLNCEYFEVDKGYPPFTAEKVIRLLEWEANRGIINIKHLQEGYQIFTYIHTGNYGKSIIDAVASYFCVKWQDLTDAEKAQIKEILE